MIKAILLATLLMGSTTVFADNNALKEYPPEVQQVTKDYLGQFNQPPTPENIKTYIDEDQQGAKTFVFMLALRKTNPMAYMLATEKLSVDGVQFTVSNFKAYLGSSDFKRDLQAVTQGLSPTKK